MTKKMTKSEAGKLGAIKSTIVAKAAKKIRITEYLNNPTLCQYCDCNGILPYEKRKNIFCSTKCARKSGRTGRRPNPKPCKNPSCYNIIETNEKIFCSTVCLHAFNQQQIFSSVEKGEASQWSVKRYLLYYNGDTCSICNITKWQGKVLKMDIDHIDGNPDNNALDNCRLICPNCHRQTPTYKGGNKGKNKKMDIRNIKRRKRYYNETGAL